MLRQLGCKPITGRPYHPQTQGKNERLHQTTQRWLRARPLVTTITELQALIDDFDDLYNHRPPRPASGHSPQGSLLLVAACNVGPQNLRGATRTRPACSE